MDISLLSRAAALTLSTALEVNNFSVEFTV